MFPTEIYSAVSSIMTGPLSFCYVVILTLEWRFPPRVMRWVISLFLVLLSVGSAAYFVVCGITPDTKLYTAMAAILSFIVFNLLFSRYPLLQMLSTYATACIFTFLSDTVCGILVPQAGLAHILAKIACFGIVALLLTCFIRRPLLEVQREIQQRKWLWMMIVPLLLCFIFFYVVQMQGPLYADPAFRPVVLALCFCVISVYISFYFVLSSLQKQYGMQSEAAVLKVHLSSLKKHAETMKFMSDQLCLLRHDLRHYINIQSVCMESGDINGMREALSSISKYVREGAGRCRLRQYTGQTLIDSILSYYAGRAEDADITFSIKLAFPDGLGDTSELAVMLSNALENAYNACLVICAGEKREIQVTGGMEACQFLLEVANTYTGDVRFDGRGHPVAQRLGHGYGTRSIASYAAKRHAQLYYRAESGWFRLRLIMNIPAATASCQSQPSDCKSENS